MPRFLLIVICTLLAGCVTPPETAQKPKVALALGGGAARGFAHVGVVKALEAHGIVPDMVVGTSAGSLVAALYAGGGDGFELQRLALGMEDSSISDWILPDRGIIRGAALQNYVNIALGNRPIEKLRRTLGVVATDLQSGEKMVFRSGNVGVAVRASSSVPGIFQPVRIGNREYVDGGLASPVPAEVAREMGADVVIAVDISSKPASAKLSGIIDVLLQTFTIMGANLAHWELTQADVVIRPNVAGISGTDFESKHLAILEGEKAATAKIEAIRSAIARAAREPRGRP